MAFTYDPTLAGARDKLRFLLRDIVEATAVYQDEELDAMLIIYGGSLEMTRLQLLLVLLAEPRRFIKWTQSQNSVDKSGALDALKLLIGEVRAQIAVSDSSSGEIVDFADNEIDYHGMRVDPENGL